MPLTQLSLKCVLEHMEANKRIYLASRCPRLRRIERSVPLHLRNLKFEDWKLTLNDLTYRFEGNPRVPGYIDRNENDYIVTPGDKRMGPPGLLRAPHGLLTIFYGDRHKKDLPLGINFHDAMKKLVRYLLGTRFIIKVKNMDVTLLHQKVLILPVNFKVQVKGRLSTGQYCYRFMSSIFSGLDMDELKITLDSSPRISYFRTAKKLIIMDDQASRNVPIDRFATLGHKNVEFCVNSLKFADIYRMARKWIRREAEIGTRYTFKCDTFVCLTTIQKALKVPRVRLVESKSLEGRSACLGIGYAHRINNRSELLVQVYRISSGLFSGQSYVKMEVVPSEDVITPTKEARKKYALLKLVWAILTMIELFINILFK